jgi:hypothetical protein
MAIAMGRRVNTPIGRDGKRPKPREYNPAMFGIHCVAETPEGEACVALDSAVLLADGSSIRIDRLVHKATRATADGSQQPQVLVLEPRPHMPKCAHGVASHITAPFVLPRREVLCVRTITGRTLVATPDHPFLLRGGEFRRADALRVGDCVMVHVPLTRSVCGGPTVPAIAEAYQNYRIRHRAEGGEACGHAQGGRGAPGHDPGAESAHCVHCDCELTFAGFLTAVGCADYQVQNIMTWSEPILSVRAAPPQPVADFTTVSDHHTFVANGFVTHNCGLVKNLAITAHISVRSCAGAARSLLLVAGMTPERVHPGDASVLLNGDWCGFVTSAHAAAARLRGFRRAGNLASDVSIAVVHDRAELTVLTCEGRVCRPLLIVSPAVGGAWPGLVFSDEHINVLASGRGQPDFSPFSWLLGSGAVEMIDADEMQDCRIAWCPCELVQSEPASTPKIQFTHVEVHESTCFGTCAGMIPFAEHNQAPRNTYQVRRKCPHIFGGSSDTAAKSLHDVAVSTQRHVLSRGPCY